MSEPAFYLIKGDQPTRAGHEYQGRVVLPDGQVWSIEASVFQDSNHPKRRHFEGIVLPVHVVERGGQRSLPLAGRPALSDAPFVDDPVPEVL